MPDYCHGYYCISKPQQAFILSFSTFKRVDETLKFLFLCRCKNYILAIRLFRYQASVLYMVQSIQP